MLMQTQVLTGKTLDAVAFVGATNIFAGDDEANAGMAKIIGTRQQGELRRASPGRLVKDLLELLGSKEPELPTKFQRWQPGQGGRLNLNASQLGAAFGTATGQNLAAILGGHAGTEAVGALALQHAGLKCAFHYLIR